VVDTLKQQRDNIRAAIKPMRRALDPAALNAASQGLLSNCKSFLKKSNMVAGYQAMHGEISLDPIFNYCHENGITTLLPIMRNQSLMFAPFNTSTTFSIKQYGIQEPDTDKEDWIAPENLELVLVPLVAFDNTCNRIGMGGGFYDRSFEFRKSAAAPPTLIGVAHALQQVNNVYPQEWDVPLDMVATDETLFKPG